MATTITLIPQGTYAAGSHPLGPAVVPVGLTFIIVRVDRASLLSSTLIIDWAIEISLDGGSTWIANGGASTIGGSIPNPDTGLPYTESAFSVSLPQPANTNRRIRGTVSNNESATTKVTADLS